MRPFPQGMSPACMSFVSAMMIRDVQQRPSAKQLLQHPIVLTYLRTLMPAQQPAAAPLAPTSDSASSLNGSAAMPRPLFAAKRPVQGGSSKPSQSRSIIAQSPPAKCKPMVDVPWSGQGSVCLYICKTGQRCRSFFILGEGRLTGDQHKVAAAVRHC